MYCGMVHLLQIHIGTSGVERNSFKKSGRQMICPELYTIVYNLKTRCIHETLIYNAYAKE